VDLLSGSLGGQSHVCLWLPSSDSDSLLPYPNFVGVPIGNKPVSGRGHLLSPKECSDFCHVCFLG
jgi:hypothetical protein